MSLAIPRSACLLLALALARPAGAGEVEVTREALQMGTYARITLTADDRAHGLALAGAGLAAIEDVEALLSTWRPQSEVSRVNQAPVGEAVPILEALVDVLARTFATAARTEGAFDPAVGALTVAWDLHGKGRIPETRELEAAAAATGPEAFELDPATGSICRGREGASLDTGGFGKGEGLDAAARVLRRAGVRKALLDLGGQVLALGGPQAIGLADPDARETPIGVLLVKDASVSTSGNAERGLTVAGRPVGHLLDPATGAPADDLGSVTVLAPTGLEADVLSTALFVLGSERGLALVRGWPGVEAGFLFHRDRGPGRVRLVATPGFVARLSAVAPDVDLEAPVARTAAAAGPGRAR